MLMKSAIGIVEDLIQVEQIITRAHASGFTYGDISVIFPDREGTRDFTPKNGNGHPASDPIGVDATSALRLLGGFGTLAVPGIGPVIAAGPIRDALNVAALGGLAGALAWMGIQDYEAVIYQGRVIRGNFLVSIHSDDTGEIDRAKAIIEDCGAGDISTVTETGMTHHGIWREDVITKP